MRKIWIPIIAAVVLATIAKAGDDITIVVKSGPLGLNRTVTHVKECSDCKECSAVKENCSECNLPKTTKSTRKLWYIKCGNCSSIHETHLLFSPIGRKLRCSKCFETVTIDEQLSDLETLKKSETKKKITN